MGVLFTAVTTSANTHDALADVGVDSIVGSPNNTAMETEKAETEKALDDANVVRAARRSIPPVDDPTIEEIIVVGSYLPRQRAFVDGALSVIARETLVRSTTMADSIATVPGLALSRSGGTGQLTEIRLRGAEANHTLVLIDGMLANDPATGGAVDFGAIVPTDIDRIEVLRGPQSTRYGSEAIGGAVNLVSALPPLGTDWRIGGSTGAPGYHQTNAMWSVASPDGHVHVGFDRRLSDGVSASRIEPERDGYDATTAFIRAGIERGRTSVQGSVRSIDRMVEIDTQDFGFPPGPTQGLVVDADQRTHSRVVLANMAWIRAGATPQSVRMSVMDSSHRQFTAVDPTGRISASRVRAGYDATRAWGRHRGVVAIDFDQTRFDNRHGVLADANFTRTERQWSVATEYRVDGGRSSGSLGLRHDSNRSFRDATTVRLGGSYQIGPGVRAYAAWGTGITNPTFFERFGFFPSSFVGNPELVPESSKGVDLGIRSQHGRWRWDVTIFDATLDDEITTVFDFATFTSSPVNADDTSSRRGIELTAGYDAVHWSFDLNATLLESREADGRVEVRRPRRQASVSIERRLPRAIVFLNARFSAGRQDVEFVQSTPADRAWLDDFVIADFGVRTRLGPGVEAFLSIDNLLDEEYEEVFGYAAMPRSVVVGVEIARR